MRVCPLPGKERVTAGAYPSKSFVGAHPGRITPDRGRTGQALPERRGGGKLSRRPA